MTAWATLQLSPFSIRRRSRVSALRSYAKKSREEIKEHRLLTPRKHPARQAIEWPGKPFRVDKDRLGEGQGCSCLAESSNGLS